MSGETHLELLRRFEPVVRYTRGERFFPIEIDGYVRQSSLWVQRPGQPAECLIPEGELSPERLAEPYPDVADAVHFLRFIEPMNIAELAAYRIQQVREQLAAGPGKGQFRAGRGRLARVGYLSRLVDALFSLTLLARGRISGDTAAAAAITYRNMLAERERYVYYGRVMEQSGWTVLQYWFFYPFNCWRSGFFGVNDHEADWEMICVFLDREPGDRYTPQWIAYAAHDFGGDDLRRRWDDPSLQIVGETHPVVYAGAGSHASYYERGEYLTEIEIPFLAPLVRVTRAIQELGARLMRRITDHTVRQEAGPTFRVPFVDYARGDGLAIGPGQERAWDEPRLLNPTPGWALHFRGLWGVYVRDLISGENAPAGPLYNRDGSPRRTWCDPVGWAGLDKVPSPGQSLALLRRRQAEVQARQTARRAEVADKSEQLFLLGLQADALQEQPHLSALYQTTRVEISALSTELADLRTRLAEDNSLQEALALHLSRLSSGERPPPDAHLRHPHHPASSAELRLGRLAEGWAAVSVGLLLISVVILVILAQEYLAVAIAALIALVIVIESSFRRRLHLLITWTTIALAVLSAGVLLYEFFWPILVVAVLLVGAYLTIDNLRELWK